MQKVKNFAVSLIKDIGIVTGLMMFIYIIFR